jgi:hypothetical protein
VLGQDLTPSAVSAGGVHPEPIGLVVDFARNFAKLLRVRATMMCAEQQLTAGRQGHPDVGLGATAVAAVRGRKRCGNCSSHVIFSPILGISNPANIKPGAG